MAKVNIEEIIEHLDYDIKRALEDTFVRCYPGISIDRNRLFKEFVKAIRRKCNTWEKVPDRYIRME